MEQKNKTIKIEKKTSDFNSKIIIECVDDKNKDKIIDYINNSDFSNMYELVLNIRLLLENCGEEQIIINYETKGEKEYIKFEKQRLTMYEKSISENDLILKGKYYLNYGLDISYNIEDIYAKKNFVQKHIIAMLDEVSNLQKYGMIPVSEEERKLINLYKNFYDEPIDFNDEQINFKLQSMMNILSYLGVTIEKYNLFIRWNDREVPTNTNIEKSIDRLKPYGKICEFDDTKIERNVENKINLVNSIIYNKGPRNDILRNLSNAIGAKKKITDDNEKIRLSTAHESIKKLLLEM